MLLTLGSEAQLQMLEAAATTIDLIESKVLSLLGELAVLFLPEPAVRVHQRPVGG
jgi:hypothetical protein